MLELSTQRSLTGQEIPLHELALQPWLSAPAAPAWQTALLGQV
jgi:hypothetical protein